MDKKEPRGAEQANLSEKQKALPAEIIATSPLDDASDDSEDAVIDPQIVPGTPGEMIPGFLDIKTSPAQGPRDLPAFGASRKYVAYTIKLPAEQLAALNSIWLELKRLYGSHSPDKSGMIQQAVQDWLKRWDGPEKQKLLIDLLEIREDTRKRQYKKN
ncbi:MAG: hypothetical protein KGS72_12885 [Cyanobacteria bacterium REEB67]|nr:hypothetical protein [Cyanobacteria bacterium REEB67]